MKLLTKEIRQSLPGLYATEDEKDPMVHVRFFSPWMDWTWYAAEFDGKNLFFGLVEGSETEWGYFSLSELKSLRGPCGVPAVERDLHFGQEVEFTYRRGGDTQTVSITAEIRHVDVVVALPPEPDVAPRRVLRVETLRYAGTVGDVDVEVRGDNSVIISVIKDGEEIEIVTSNSRILLRRRN